MDVNSTMAAMQISPLSISPVVTDSAPSQFRYVQSADGTMTLQCGYRYMSTAETGINWMDIPVVNN